MTSAVLYREAITKTPGLFVGGVKLPFRSMRASWARVSVQIDGASAIELRQSIPREVDLEAGSHTIVARGKGFETAQTVIQTHASPAPVIVITPLHRDGVSSATPLGALSIHEESDLSQLQPYAFYKGRSLSPAANGVLHSVITSMAVCGALFLAGLGLLALIPVEFATRGPGTGVFVLVLGLALSSVLVPAGLGGFIIGLRFLRLPRAWRSPLTAH